MKRLIITCEGETEQEFCKDVLAPYFLSKEIYIEYPTIKHSNGGIVAWATLKKQLVNHLHEGDAVVTMLIDYYRIKDSYLFPGWEEVKQIENVFDRMRLLFIRMKEDMPAEFRERFIPYVQLHEFEGLLFSDISVFSHNFTSEELQMDLLDIAVKSANTPEEINNGPDTAPSVRLLKAIAGYNKVVYGACLASEIGLSVICSKCKLFNEWIISLENRILPNSQEE